MNKYNKNWITRFNKNKSKEYYKEILNEEFPNNIKCKDCEDVIYYYDSTFINSKNRLHPHKKSFLSFKNIFENIYYLSVCEECLIKKYPEYDTYNKSRVFNRLCDITAYAYNIPNNISNLWKKRNYAITLENLIIKHGDLEGNKIWNNYLEKQSVTNSFEYKKEKYGWDEDKFKEFNLSRSVTIENMIKKHGELKGITLWNDYIERQKYTCSKEYFIKEYGDITGLEKFENFSKQRTLNGGYSKISITLFDKLKSILSPKNYTIFYGENEYFFNTNGHFYLVDFFIKDLNIAIEFNGDVWHANPLLFKEDDRPFPFDKKYTSKDIWERDSERLKFLKDKVKDVIIIWEKELSEKGINRIVEELMEKIKIYEYDGIQF